MSHQPNGHFPNQQQQYFPPHGPHHGPHHHGPPAPPPGVNFGQPPRGPPAPPPQGQQGFAPGHPPAPPNFPPPPPPGHGGFPQPPPPSHNPQPPQFQGMPPQGHAGSYNPQFPNNQQFHQPPPHPQYTQVQPPLGHQHSTMYAQQHAHTQQHAHSHQHAHSQQLVNPILGPNFGQGQQGQQVFFPPPSAPRGVPSFPPPPSAGFPHNPALNNPIVGPPPSFPPPPSLCNGCRQKPRMPNFDFCSAECLQRMVPGTPHSPPTPNAQQGNSQPMPPAGGGGGGAPGANLCKGCMARPAVPGFPVCSKQCNEWSPMMGCLTCRQMATQNRFCSDACRYQWIHAIQRGGGQEQAQAGSPKAAASSSPTTNGLPGGAADPAADAAAAAAPVAPTKYDDFVKLVEAGDLATLDANEQTLKKHIHRPNEMGETLLHLAVKKGHLDVVQKLHTLGANLLAPTSVHGFSPLHLSVGHNRPDIAEYIVTNCGDECLKAVDGWGYYPFDRAGTNAALRRITGPTRPPMITQSTDEIDERVLWPSYNSGRTEARVALEPASAEFKQIVYMMNTTIKPIHGSYLGRPYACFVVKSITRLFDAKRWQECDTQPKSQTGRPFWYLWHGTSLKAQLSIEKGQFNQSAYGTHGPAIYLAKNSSVAHLHAKKHDNSQQEKGNKHHYMFLCCVNVGKWAQSVEKPDFSDKRTRISDMRTATNADTIVQSMPKNGSEYMEVMLWEPKRVYPCYRIEYQPVDMAGEPITNPCTA